MFIRLVASRHPSSKLNSFLKREVFICYTEGDTLKVTQLNDCGTGREAGRQNATPSPDRFSRQDFPVCARAQCADRSP